jgi:hypothetical protein
VAWKKDPRNEIAKEFKCLANYSPAPSKRRPNLDEQEKLFPKPSFQKKFSETKKTRRKRSNI